MASASIKAVKEQQAAEKTETTANNNSAGAEPAKASPTIDQIVANTVIDDGPFANYIDTKRFNQLWRIASGFARSTMVPEHFQGKPDNCFIAVQMAMRLGVDPFMFMQKCYIVHGKPGIEAQLAIALVNTSGIFRDALDYEIEGTDARKDDYRVRVVACRKSTGKDVAGPWVDWPLVRGEEWDKKKGSKWVTMPGLMFMYRAAMFFARMHCPERLMGMSTVEELFDADGASPDGDGRGKAGRNGSPVNGGRAPRYEQDAAAAAATERIRGKSQPQPPSPGFAAEDAMTAPEPSQQTFATIYSDLRSKCSAVASVDDAHRVAAEVTLSASKGLIDEEQALGLSDDIQFRIENL